MKENSKNSQPIQELNIYQKIAYVQSKVSGVHKDSKGYNYNYESLDEIITALHPHVSEKSLAICHTVETREGRYVCVTKVFDGEAFVSSECPILGAETLLVKGNPMQGMGSAITYARRYNLKNLFNLYSTDDDAASIAVQPASKAQLDTMNKLLARLDINIDVPAFLQFLGVQSLTGIDESTAKKAIAALQGKLAQVKK